MYIVTDILFHNVTNWILLIYFGFIFLSNGLSSMTFADLWWLYVHCLSASLQYIIYF